MAKKKAPVVGWQGFDDCDTPDKEHEANARLIAAAPELLEACGFIESLAAELMAFRPAVDSFAFKTSQEALGKARAAIAKAEGKRIIQNP